MLVDTHMLMVTFLQKHECYQISLHVSWDNLAFPAQMQSNRLPLSLGSLLAAEMTKDRQQIKALVTHEKKAA